jgi:hypothetical protein
LPDFLTGILEGFARQNALPQAAGIQTVIKQQKIKEVAATLADMTVPARSASTPRSMHPQGGTGVLVIGVMPAKGTTAHPPLIKPHIENNDSYGILCRAPVMNGHLWPRCRGNDTLLRAFPNRYIFLSQEMLSSWRIMVTNATIYATI